MHRAITEYKALIHPLKTGTEEFYSFQKRKRTWKAVSKVNLKDFLWNPQPLKDLENKNAALHAVVKLACTNSNNLLCSFFGCIGI